MQELAQACPRRPPHEVLWLGYGGLLPFLALAILVGVDAHRAPLWSQALVAYAAVILSFVGALHWGFGMSLPRLDPGLRRRALAWSVVPALLAWPAILLPGEFASWILLAGFALHLVQDLRLARCADLPAWYLPLRWRLTVVAGLCLVVNAWYAMGRG